MDSSDLKLEDIITVFENIESQNLEKDDQIAQWLDQITKPEFQLIDSLISLFLESIQDNEITSNILKVLRKFVYFRKENVIGQMKNSQMFPKALSEYIAKNDGKISGDAFVLLSQIFEKNSFSSVKSDKFVNSLLKGLSLINDEDVFHSIVWIIIEMNNEDSNSVIDNVLNNENKNILVESLLRILNSETEKEKIYKIFQFFIDLFDKVDYCLFYKNDIESYINVVIKILESTYTDKMRIMTLKSLEKISKFKEFKEVTYKKDSLIEILENYQYSDNVDEESKELSGKALNNLS